MGNINPSIPSTSSNSLLSTIDDRCSAIRDLITATTQKDPVEEHLYFLSLFNSKNFGRKLSKNRSTRISSSLPKENDDCSKFSSLNWDFSLPDANDVLRMSRDDRLDCLYQLFMEFCCCMGLKEMYCLCNVDQLLTNSEFSMDTLSSKFNVGEKKVESIDEEFNMFILDADFSYAHSKDRQLVEYLLRLYKCENILSDKERMEKFINVTMQRLKSKREAEGTRVDKTSNSNLVTEFFDCVDIFLENYFYCLSRACLQLDHVNLLRYYAFVWKNVIRSAVDLYLRMSNYVSNPLHILMKTKTLCMSTFFNQEGICIPKAVREIMESESRGGPVNTSSIPEAIVLSYEIFGIIKSKSLPTNMEQKPSPISFYNFMQWHSTNFPTCSLKIADNEQHNMKNGLKRKSIEEINKNLENVKLGLGRKLRHGYANFGIKMNDNYNHFREPSMNNNMPAGQMQHGNGDENAWTNFGYLNLDDPRNLQMGQSDMAELNDIGDPMGYQSNDYGYENPHEYTPIYISTENGGMLNASQTCMEILERAFKPFNKMVNLGELLQLDTGILNGVPRIMRPTTDLEDFLTSPYHDAREACFELLFGRISYVFLEKSREVSGIDLIEYYAESWKKYFTNIQDFYRYHGLFVGGWALNDYLPLNNAIRIWKYWFFENDIRLPLTIMELLKFKINADILFNVIPTEVFDSYVVLSSHEPWNGTLNELCSEETMLRKSQFFKFFKNFDKKKKEFFSANPALQLEHKEMVKNLKNQLKQALRINFSPINTIQETINQLSEQNAMNESDNEETYTNEELIRYVEENDTHIFDEKSSKYKAIVNADTRRLNRDIDKHITDNTKRSHIRSLVRQAKSRHANVICRKKKRRKNSVTISMLRAMHERQNELVEMITVMQTEMAVLKIAAYSMKKNE